MNSFIFHILCPYCKKHDYGSLSKQTFKKQICKHCEKEFIIDGYHFPTLTSLRITPKTKKLIGE